jgi:hypothetical protein
MQDRASHLIENAGEMSQEAQNLCRVKAAELEGGTRMGDIRVDCFSAELGIQVRIWSGLGGHGG